MEVSVQMTCPSECVKQEGTVTPAQVPIPPSPAQGLTPHRLNNRDLNSTLHCLLPYEPEPVNHFFSANP